MQFRILFIALAVGICIPSNSSAEVILNRASDKALDAHSNDLNKNGCKVQLWDYLGGANQEWKIEAVGGGFVRIVNSASGLVLDANSNDVNKNGCVVQLWEWKGELQQQWKLAPILEGGVAIINRASGKVLDAHSDDVHLLTCRLQLWDYKAEPQQVWRIEKALHPVPNNGINSAAYKVNQRLRVFLVFDTKADGGIAPGVRANKRRLLEVLDELRNGREQKFTIDIVEGDEVKPAVILNYYKSLHVKSGDALFFYYSGHGGWDNQKRNAIDEKGHYLAMTGGSLYRADLRAIMQSKGANAVFLISDACSNIASVKPPARRKPADWSGFQNLFFGHRGVYDIQAATRTEFGWYGVEGGLFTSVFTKLLCEPSEKLRLAEGSGPVGWNAFFVVLRKETLALFDLVQKAEDMGGLQRNPKGDIRDSDAQTVQALYLGERPLPK